MTSTIKKVSAGVVALLLTLLAYGWLTFPEVEPYINDARSTNWNVPQLYSTPNVSLADLQSTFLWHSASELQNNELKPGNTASNKDSAIGEAEAKKLRQSIKLISSANGEYSVWFQVQDQYMRYSQGDQLSDTVWKVHDIQPDYLILLNSDDQQLKKLSLFAGAESISGEAKTTP